VVAKEPVEERDTFFGLRGTRLDEAEAAMNDGDWNWRKYFAASESVRWWLRVRTCSGDVGVSLLSSVSETLAAEESEV